VLEPLERRARLAALVPPPADPAQPSTPRHVAMSWAQRLKRVFGIEIDTCQRCGGNLRIIASIEQPEVIAKILSHLERTAPQPHPPDRPGESSPGERSRQPGRARHAARNANSLGTARWFEFPIPAYLAAVAVGALGVDAIHGAVRGRRCLLSRIGLLP